MSALHNTMPPNIILRAANEDDAAVLSSFLNIESHVHRHLDWRSSIDWLAFQPYYLLTYEKSRKILASLACPPDPPEIAWIRLFAASQLVNLSEAWHLLLNKAISDIKTMPGVKMIAAIALRSWFIELLINSEFQHVQDIVVLERESQPIDHHPFPPGITVRPMLISDLPAVEQVDHLSFAPLWQNSSEGLTHAYHQAAYSSVAEKNGQIIGYQISTENPYSAHLARLAVNPELQGRGIGYNLVVDLLEFFQKKSVQRVTVNTQNDNKTSLSLYQKLGFRPNQESFPVYLYTEFAQTKP